MKLPFVYLDKVYHVGKLSPDGRGVEPRPVEKQWDYEFGLLSVSLNPDAWRDWAGQGSHLYEISRFDGPMKLIEADLCLRQRRKRILQCAINNGLLVMKSGGLEGTDELYDKLGLVSRSLSPLSKRTNDEQLLQASLAVLAMRHDVTGMWWSDTLGGEMRTERGGIFQFLLPDLSVCIVNGSSTLPAPAARLETSAILSRVPLS